jgi:hypothetical protein
MAARDSMPPSGKRFGLTQRGGQRAVIAGSSRTEFTHGQRGTIEGRGLGLPLEPGGPMDKLLEMNQITKSFYGVRVLQDVDFELAHGEVHVLHQRGEGHLHPCI